MLVIVYYYPELTKKGHEMAFQKKGTEGKNTGGSTRKAIRSVVKKGCTIKSIGKASGRSPSTISKIANGEIKNPPKGLAGAIRKTRCKKK